MDVIDRISKLLDDAGAETANTSMRLPTALRDAAAIAVDELGVAPSTTALTAEALRGALDALVLDTAAIQPVDKLPKAADIGAGCAWLGADLGPRAEAVLRTGRLAQEALGYERLLDNPVLLTELA